MKLGRYDLNQLLTGDARELVYHIPDESVDLIFTDPEYHRIPDYAWLAEVACRILKPGGNLIAQAGNEHRFEAEATMRTSGLTPRPLLIEVYATCRAQLFKHKLLIGYKPYLWFSKGKCRLGGWIFNRQEGGGRDKAAHQWGDSERFASEYILRLTNPGDIVVDFFAGGGTVPAVCQRLGRHFLAFEVDPQTAETARRRLQTLQPALFTPQAKGLAMLEV
jgi:DNA modification methylase